MMIVNKNMIGVTHLITFADQNVQKMTIVQMKRRIVILTKDYASIVRYNF